MTFMIFNIDFMIFDIMTLDIDSYKIPTYPEQSRLRMLLRRRLGDAVLALTFLAPQF